MHFRHRRRLRQKEIEKYSVQLRDALGCDVFSAKDTVDMAEGQDYEIILVNGEILAMVLKGVPFLTVRGLLKYQPARRYITVDMGAIPFVCNGADVMCPGIIEADASIKKDDFVWIRDMKNKKPLATGIALLDGGEMKRENKGKAVKSVHYVGDALWNFEL